jgi:hypothetical protein
MMNKLLKFYWPWAMVKFYPCQVDIRGWRVGLLDTILKGDLSPKDFNIHAWFKLDQYHSFRE